MLINLTRFMTSKDLSAIYEMIKTFFALNTPKKAHGNQKIPDEVIFYIYITACLGEQGSFRRAIRRLNKEKLLPVPVSESAFSRRIKRLKESIELFSRLLIIRQRMKDEPFIVDSCPLPTMNRVRAKRNTRKGQARWGKCAAQNCFYFGFKLHAIIDPQHKMIVNSHFTPANVHDLTALTQFSLDLPFGSRLLADKAYNSKAVEKEIKTQQGVELQPIQKKPKGREMTYSEGEKNTKKARKRRLIESVFSSFKRYLPSKIDFVKEDTYLLKIQGFIIAHNLKICFPEYFY